MLFYFILGILFVSIALPITTFFSSWLDVITQYITYKYAYKIYKIKILMTEKEEEDQDQKGKIPMGFHTDLIGVKLPSHQEFEQEED